MVTAQDIAMKALLELVPVAPPLRTDELVERTVNHVAQQYEVSGPSVIKHALLLTKMCVPHLKQ